VTADELLKTAFALEKPSKLVVEFKDNAQLKHFNFNLRTASSLIRSITYFLLSRNEDEVELSVGFTGD